MKVFIFCLGTRKPYDLDLDITVAEQKKKWSHQIQLNDYWLLWNDQILEDAQTLRHYTIQENDNMWVVMRAMDLYFKIAQMPICNKNALLCKLHEIST